MAADGHGDWTRRSVFQLTGAAFALPALQSSLLESGPMPFTPKFVDLVRNVTSVTGTGPVVLGQAVNGYTSLASAVSTGDQFYYCIQGIDKPTEREIGRGTMQADGKVARQPIMGAATNFTSGTKTIALVAAAEWFSKLDQAGSAGMGASASRIELAGKDGSAAGRMFLAEGGRAGSFVFDPSNLSARVSADPGQGLYVAPASDPTGASGAWVRKFDGPVNVKWFGATGDGVTNDGAAFAAALALLKALAANSEVYYKGSPRLFIPAGHYFLATTTLDITHTLVIDGESSVNGYGSRLRWADNVTGIRIQAYNTNGASGVDPAPYHFSGSYTTIRGLALVGGVPDTEGGFSGSEGEFHGIHARSNVIIEDVYINGFRGDGVHANTSIGAGGAGEGNSNCSFINRLRVTNVRNGVYLDGADANAWTIIGVIGTYCRQHTVWDSSFLGNTHIGHHSANAGLVPGVPASVVSFSGNRYFVRQGQAAGASINAPSGTTADNSWWLYIGGGGVNAPLNIPAWISGISVREGGGYRADSANGYNVFVGCYQEGGEGPSQFVCPTTVIGGLIEPKTTGNIYAGNRLVAPNNVTLGQTRAAVTTGGQLTSASIVRVHNDASLAASTYAKMDFAQGFEADGTSPCALAAISAYGASSNPATTAGNITFATRQYLTGVMTDRLMLDGGNDTFRPYNDNSYDFGLAGFRWKAVFGYTGDFTTQVKIAGTKVIGAQGAALPANATDLATAIALVNAMKARMVAHGLVAP